MQIIKTLHMGK